MPKLKKNKANAKAREDKNTRAGLSNLMNQAVKKHFHPHVNYGNEKEALSVCLDFTDCVFLERF